MIKAPTPENEYQRLKALKKYNVLDTEKERIFDELSETAAQICNCEISLITLLDENRQWFKSTYGLNYTETPRDISFCGHAIMKGDILIIKNSQKDERFIDNPLCINDPHIRFYAGVPLIDKDGYALGTLCVIDKEEKNLEHYQVLALKSLAKHVVTYFELSLKEKELEKQRDIAFRNSKMASIGELAAGVGHEINNPMTIITGYIEVMKKLSQQDTVPKEKLKQFLENMDLAAKRVIDIVKNLSSFSRQDNKEKIDFNISDLIYESTEMLRMLFDKKGIQLEVDLDPECYVHGLRGRFQQVLLNLLSNAKDAVLENGKNEKWIKIECKLNNNEVEILFSDNGVGINPENEEKIFDAFYTTKDVNKGTGIGLSLSFQIVKEHNGQLSIKETKPGKGTTFRLVFPASKKMISSFEYKSSQKNNKTKKSGKKILVVDDEQEVCDILGMYLTDYNHEVSFASNGKEAYKIYTEQAQEIDLIISDVRMPEMSGIELLEQIRKNKKLKQPKFILMTAGSVLRFDEASEILKKLIDGYLYKPFQQNQIEQIMQEIASENLESK